MSGLTALSPTDQLFFGLMIVGGILLAIAIVLIIVGYLVLFVLPVIDRMVEWLAFQTSGWLNGQGWLFRHDDEVYLPYSAQIAALEGQS